MFFKTFIFKVRPNMDVNKIIEEKVREVIANESVLYYESDRKVTIASTDTDRFDVITVIAVTCRFDVG